MNPNAEKDLETQEKEKAKKEEQKEVDEAIMKNTSQSLIQKLVYLNKLNDDKDTIIEKEFDAEQKVLQAKYNLQYQSIYQAMNSIVNGVSSCSITAEEKKEYQILDDVESASLPNNSPIEDYWSKVVINAKYFEMNENDKKVLKHLKNVNMIRKDNSEDFTIEFAFEKNEFFEHAILSKAYTMKENGTVKSAVSNPSPIAWLSQDVNPTVKKKQVKVKKGKSMTKKTTYEQVDSFFNFFDDKVKDDVSFLEDEVQFFDSDLFANQLEYYLDIMDIEGDGDDDDEEEEEEDDDDDDGDDDEDEGKGKKKKKKKGKQQKGGKASKKSGGDSDKPSDTQNAECKNQ